MGTDIHGWVEQRAGDAWAGVLPLADNRFENYDMFGCLFGVRNHANFAPVAAARGIPADAAPETRQSIQEWAGESHSHSWIGWDEIAAIDWEESSIGADGRVHAYHQHPDGRLEYQGKALTYADLTTGITDNAPIQQQWEAQRQVEVADTVYKLEPVQRKQALSPAWKALFEQMAATAATVGPQNVRLVVWFDS